jgi:glucosamine--fructose-6-phosphate aminotransferase (isomerizing)
MCGIFGIVSKTKQNICEKIIQGLIQLQNRGYDSSGFSILGPDNSIVVEKYASTRSENSLDKLQYLVPKQPQSCIGIGHNRWATHGQKNDTNAHPHVSSCSQFALVHNGIIENYLELKNELLDEDFTFVSQTDSEVIVNLISFYYRQTNDTKISIELTIGKLQGTYGIIVLDSLTPDKLFCVRNGSPLLIGKNEGDCIIATSEQSGFCNLVSNYITLQNDDICIIDRTNLEIKTSGKYEKSMVSFGSRDLTPHPFAHWTLKEIHYQPSVVLNAINNGGRIAGPSRVKLGGLSVDTLIDVNNIVILGCGTSYFAALYGMHFFKRLCNLNTVQVFDGADFSEYDIPKQGKTALILVSQSGETKDLHRCIEIAERNRMVTIGVINAVDSLIAREVDCGVYCNAGVEVGVASTKAFTSQVVCLSLIAIWFSQIHQVNEHLRTKVISDLQNLSNDFKNAIEHTKDQIKQLAETMVSCSSNNNMFVLGKGTDEYIAKEGSLKVKEISYVHCEGYSASSLKHGPFALLDEDFPVIILDLDNKHRTKVLNCIEEVHSRNAPITVISNSRETKGNQICVPYNASYASLLGIVPLQLLAYYMSIRRSINPDKPKNLAKVVTVE